MKINNQNKNKNIDIYFILDQTKLSVKQLTPCLPSSSTAFSYKAIGTAVTFNKNSVIILQGVQQNRVIILQGVQQYSVIILQGVQQNSVIILQGVQQNNERRIHGCV